jgi:hypothetical protein
LYHNTRVSCGLSPDGTDRTRLFYDIFDKTFQISYPVDHPVIFSLKKFENSTQHNLKIDFCFKSQVSKNKESKAIRVGTGLSNLDLSNYFYNKHCPWLLPSNCMDYGGA